MVFGELSAAVAFVGFDSAWADRPKAPGALCSIVYGETGFSDFQAPGLVGFASALACIRTLHRADRPTIVAIDQPTIVSNATGMRAAERVVASVVSWAGGGVQPANRGRRGLFDDGAPVWRFLDALGATDDPLCARAAASGLFVMEVFPALAVLSWDERFLGRLLAPRYNPTRPTFRPDHWRAVVSAAEAEAQRLGCAPAARWLADQKDLAKPRKADQDRLDAVLCLLVGLRWRLAPPSESVMVGDLVDGYIVAPASGAMRAKLATKAKDAGVAIT